MLRRATFFALLLSFAFATVSEAQLFRRLRAARQNSAEALQKEADRERRDAERAREKVEKENEKLQKDRLRQMEKDARQRSRLTINEPTDADAPVFTRPRAASPAELRRNANVPPVAPNRASNQATIPDLYYLDAAGRAQVSKEATLNPARQYYLRKSTVQGRDGLNYLVLDPVTRDELAAIIRARSAQGQLTNPGSIIAAAATPPVAPAGFNEPLPKPPVPDGTSSILSRVETLEAAKIPVAPTDAAKESESNGAMRSVLETVEEKNSDGPVIKPPKRGGF